MKQRQYAFPAIGCLCVVMLTAFAALAWSAEEPAAPAEQEIRITAKKFQYAPNEITVRKGVPVVLRITSQDVLHGFFCPGLKIRMDILPGRENVLRFTPDKEGVFPFHCDNFCGMGHGEMTGTITVTP